jgi:hypothetical protein
MGNVSRCAHVTFAQCEAAVAERRQLLDSAMMSVGQAADPQTDAAIKLVAWASGGMLRPAPEDAAGRWDAPHGGAQFPILAGLPLVPHQLPTCHPQGGASPACDVAHCLTWRIESSKWNETIRDTVRHYPQSRLLRCG